jgi:DNA-binding transcriptional ArsR family regulator
MRQVPEGQSLVLDFEGVSVMDTSFADATVLQLALNLAAQQYGDRYLILRNPSAATVYNIEGAIARRKARVTLVVESGTERWTLGHLERNLAEAWQLVLRDGSMTARQLADRLGLEINTASTRLRKLYDARLLARREESTKEGRQHVYSIPA